MCVDFIELIFRIYSLSFTVIVDLPVVVVMGLGCIATAATISIGLAFTCQRVAEEYQHIDLVSQ